MFSQASAHYFFPYFIANGNFTGYYEYVREDTQSYMPVKDEYTQDLMRCNTGSQQYANATGTYKVKAGDTIGFGLDFGATIEHPGPLQVYLSKSPTGTEVHDYDGSGDWFKIYELGPNGFGSDGITWGVTGIGNFTFKLPVEVPAGQYLVRIEHIAVHGAGTYGDAEFYFNCAQIEVESDSVASPGPTVKIPGLYTGYEPGILFYMYRDWIVNYTMPGPRPFPDLVYPNVTASGVSVCPATSWTLPAVTRYPSSSLTQAITSSSATASSSVAASSSVTTSLVATSSLAPIPLTTATPLTTISSVALSSSSKTSSLAVTASISTTLDELSSTTLGLTTQAVNALTISDQIVVTETVTVRATGIAACPAMHDGN
ncbi:Glycoside hydrolase family 61 [Penicillium verhagenii]|nr:Glycoside hydrolase family 61 [Penicillium verhagenii]